MLSLGGVLISFVVLIVAWMRAASLLNARSDWSLIAGLMLLVTSVVFVAASVYAAVSGFYHLREARQDKAQLHTQSQGELARREGVRLFAATSAVMPEKEEASPEKVQKKNHE